ncbi:MAG: hypothetical protein AAFR46_18450, partial [Pseudomonadota bacterium]
VSACLAVGGRVMPDTIPRVTRARPFRSIKALIGPDGERWLPCHGVFAAGRAGHGLNAVRDVLAQSAETDPTPVDCTLLLAAVGGEIIVEPQLYWTDALSGFQRAYAAPSQVAPHRNAPPDPQRREAAFALRRKLIAAMAASGCAHLQIGRSYPYRDTLAPGMRGVLEALKAELDPDGILNPGVLGLGGSAVE